VVVAHPLPQQPDAAPYPLREGTKTPAVGELQGEPVVLLHGAFMTITNNWDGWISEHSKTRKVLAVEMQGHGRTADIPRDITYDNLAADVAALLKDLKIPRADLIGYSMGGAVAMQCAIRHPAKVRRAVIMSSTFRRDGMTTEGYDFGADKLKATTAPMFFIHGDADGVRLAHVAEMFRLKGGEIHGDIKPRSASRLAILPNTTHVTLLQRMPVIVPMVNGFLDAKP
jgi:pimeloyl-ACP methyl ester carboxylesterase